MIIADNRLMDISQYRTLLALANSGDLNNHSAPFLT